MTEKPLYSTKDNHKASKILGGRRGGDQDKERKGQTHLNLI